MCKCGPKVLKTAKTQSFKNIKPELKNKQKGAGNNPRMSDRRIML